MMKISREILKTFPGQLDYKNIKFAKTTDKKILILATDDEKTHSLLSSPWPSNAFQGGLKAAVPKKQRVFELLVRGIDQSEDLELLKQAKNQVS